MGDAEKEEPLDELDGNHADMEISSIEGSRKSFAIQGLVREETRGCDSTPPLHNRMISSGRIKRKKSSILLLFFFR